MALLILLLAISLILLSLIIHRVRDPLRKIPGPSFNALTRWALAYSEFLGERTRTIDALHQQYGPIVRVGPREIHFNSLPALRTIYGAGSPFKRTAFYHMFDAYGRQNLFTFSDGKQHAGRKKLLAHVYAKSSVIKGHASELVQSKVANFLQLIENEPQVASETFNSLHYFAIDAITEFLYGRFGRTEAIAGRVGDRGLLTDIVNTDRRKLAWFAVHMPSVVKWVYTRQGFLEHLLQPLLPMQKPTTYSGIRAHALQAWISFKAAAEEHSLSHEDREAIVSKLWKHHVTQNEGGLDDLDIASEAADHLLAGIDTTSDSLMFLIWALSRPQNQKYQEKLVKELLAIPDTRFDGSGVPSAEVVAGLPYLNAVIKETLRLYTPLPASEPRYLDHDTVVDGAMVPAGTTVSMSPYSLHRNPQIFRDPMVWDPERWLGGKRATDETEMKKWFWAFSSGARMCIGIHLAMVEMTVLVAALYRNYSTHLQTGFEGKTPGVTSRFEVFYDINAGEMVEHECWIRFRKQS